MDPDEVARLVNKLNISTKTNTTTVNISETVRKEGSMGLGHYLVGKVFSIRVVNREALRAQVPRILQLRRKVDIDIVGDNLFAIVFASEEDRVHALKDGPCHFFDSLMVFKVPVGLQNPTNIVLNEFTTWVQLYNLPFACMNPNAVRKIGEQIGKVEKMDAGEGGMCIGQFARLHVTRELDKPLQCSVQLTNDDNTEENFILVLYERLPDFSYVCGREGHVFRYCLDTEADKENHIFGSWMRASRVAEIRRARGGSYWD